MWLLALLLLASSAANGQCLGDFDDSGAVTVAELVTAVNNALRGCGEPTPRPSVSPTPTRQAVACPFALDEDTGAQGCPIAVSFSQNTGRGRLCFTTTGRWRGDGTTILIELATVPAVTIAALVTSATRADVTSYVAGIDPQAHPVTGDVRLRDYDADGTVDALELLRGPSGWFTIDGCSPWLTIFGDY